MSRPLSAGAESSSPAPPIYPLQAGRYVSGSSSLLYFVPGKGTSSATNNVISTFPDPGSS
jgi:hypothetical protein